MSAKFGKRRARFDRQILSLQDIIEENWTGSRYYQIQNQDLENMREGIYPAQTRHAFQQKSENTNMTTQNGDCSNSATNGYMSQKFMTVEIQSREVKFNGRYCKLIILKDMQQYVEKQKSDYKNRYESLLLNSYNKDILVPIEQLQKCQQSLIMIFNQMPLKDQPNTTENAYE